MTADMSLVVLDAIRPLLFLLSGSGCVMALRGFLNSLADLRALKESAVDGPRRVAAVLQIKVEAVLLAVFVAMLIPGALFIVTPIGYVDSMRLVSRITWVIVSALLVWLQWTARRTRRELEIYYDSQEDAKVHIHRRVTDADKAADKAGEQAGEKAV